jgi:hypothetical protein
MTTQVFLILVVRFVVKDGTKRRGQIAFPLCTAGECSGDVRIGVTFTGQFLFCLFQYRSEGTWIMDVPIALEFGADDASAGAPEVIADDPVALVLEHALVE